MIVHRPFNSGPGYPLLEWDVITKIRHVPIDDEGMIKISDNLRVRFAYQIQKLGAKYNVPLTIIRDGKEQKIKLPLLTERPLVIPELKAATLPSLSMVCLSSPRQRPAFSPSARTIANLPLSWRR